MLAAAKIALLTFAAFGVATTGAAGMITETPLSNAIEVHEDHLGAGTTMPDQAIKGQQNAYDHIMKNQERWLAKHPTLMPDDDDKTDEDDGD